MFNVSLTIKIIILFFLWEQHKIDKMVAITEVTSISFSKKLATV